MNGFEWGKICAVGKPADIDAIDYYFKKRKYLLFIFK